MPYCLLSGSILLLLGFYCQGATAMVPVLYGGGNVGTNGIVSNETLQQMAVLCSIGANSFRVNLYLSDYVHGLPKNAVNWSDPTPESLDGVLQAAHDAGFDSPYLLLEYYSSYYDSDGLGSYEQFVGIGKAFAEYARPGGEWARNHSARPSFGVRHFTWANEPDGTGFDAGGPIGPGPYKAALQGLSDGVKGVDPSLMVLGGGYKTPNMGAGSSLKGLGAALSDLWSNGTLDAVDLHTYNGPQYAPLNGTYNKAANHDFNGVLNYANVTRGGGAAPVYFVATELNYKAKVAGEDEATRGLLTCLVDNAGAVAPPAASGSPAPGSPSVPVSTLVFPWNLFHTPAEDSNYGMAYSLKPYRPDQRAALFAAFIQLVGPMRVPLGGSEPMHGRGITTWVPVPGGNKAPGGLGGWDFRSAGAPQIGGTFGSSLPSWFGGAVERAAAALLEADSGMLAYVQGAQAPGGVVLQVTGWQNREHWSNCTGTAFDVPLDPAAAGAATIDVVTYLGLQKSVPVCAGCKSVEI